MTTREAVLAFVTEHPGCTTVDIRRATGIDKDKVKGALDTLHARKLIGRQYSLLGLTTASWWPAISKVEAL